MNSEKSAEASDFSESPPFVSSSSASSSSSLASSSSSGLCTSGITPTNMVTKEKDEEDTGALQHLENVKFRVRPVETSSWSSSSVSCASSSSADRKTPSQTQRDETGQVDKKEGEISGKEKEGKDSAEESESGIGKESFCVGEDGDILSSEEITTEFIQQKLDENQQMLYAINENLKAGRPNDSAAFFERLQQNLTFLALLADQPTDIDETQQPISEEAFSSNSDFWSHEEIQRLHHALRRPYNDLAQLAAAVGTKTPEQVYVYLSLSVDRHNLRMGALPTTTDWRTSSIPPQCPPILPPANLPHPQSHPQSQPVPASPRSNISAQPPQFTPLPSHPCEHVPQPSHIPHNTQQPMPLAAHPPHALLSPHVLHPSQPPHSQQFVHPMHASHPPSYPPQASRLPQYPPQGSQPHPLHQPQAPLLPPPHQPQTPLLPPSHQPQTPLLPPSHQPQTPLLPPPYQPQAPLLSGNLPFSGFTPQCLPSMPAEQPDPTAPNQQGRP